MSILSMARNVFGKHLDAYGVRAVWRERTDATPATGDSDISTAYKRRDPVDDSNWRDLYDDPAAWIDHDILICFDIPAEQQSQNVGMMVSGTSVGYVKHDTNIQVGDMIAYSDVRYTVDGSRLLNPPAYREVTLRKVV